MASEFIKAEKVVSAGLGVLARNLVLPNLVWRDAGGDFAGAKDDTITIRVPAYVEAGNRVMRGSTARTRDSIHERAVTVTLTRNVNRDVPLTDEELTLDIADFGSQVLNPVLAGVARQIETHLAGTITGATYENTVTFDPDNDEVWADLVLPARKFLNDANVPFDGRSLLVGTGLEAAFLKSAMLTDASASGTTSTLREAQIGRMGGFDVFTSNAIGPNAGYAFHRTAYVLSSKAPIVPAGAPWGSSQSWEGFALRAVRILDSEEIQDILATDVFIGSNVVTDHGEYDDDDKFVPFEDPTDGDPILVRAVAINAAGS